MCYTRNFKHESGNIASTGSYIGIQFQLIYTVFMSNPSMISFVYVPVF